MALKVRLLLCIAATLYCFVGVLQAIWLSATPNFPRPRAMRDLEIWGAATLVSLTLLVWCAVLAGKHSKRP